MQVICNRASECHFICIGHSPHIHSLEGEGHDCPYRGHVCIPVQSDFERGQEKHYEQHSWWWAGILIYGGNDDPAYRGNVWCSAINPDEMPKGICRNCGHPKYTHYHWDGACDYCACRRFVLAEPLVPSTLEGKVEEEERERIFTLYCDWWAAHPGNLRPHHYFKAGYEAGKAACAKTHEALRKEGRREVVEWVEGNVRLLCTRADWQNKKEEWGL